MEIFHAFCTIRCNTMIQNSMKKLLSMCLLGVVSFTFCPNRMIGAFFQSATIHSYIKSFKEYSHNVMGTAAGLGACYLLLPEATRLGIAGSAGWLASANSQKPYQSFASASTLAYTLALGAGIGDNTAAQMTRISAALLLATYCAQQKSTPLRQKIHKVTDNVAQKCNETFSYIKDKGKSCIVAVKNIDKATFFLGTGVVTGAAACIISAYNKLKVGELPSRQDLETSNLGPALAAWNEHQGSQSLISIKFYTNNHCQALHLHKDGSFIITDPQLQQHISQELTASVQQAQATQHMQVKSYVFRLHPTEPLRLRLTTRFAADGNVHSVRLTVYEKQGNSNTYVPAENIHFQGKLWPNSNAMHQEILTALQPYTPPA